MDGKVVTVRHRAGSAAYHLLPGGGVDYRETLEDALKREIAEETGLQASIGRPLFLSDTIDPEGSRHVVNITFSAHVTGGEIVQSSADSRIEAVDLVEPAGLLDLDLRPPMAADVLRAIAHPELHAEYLGSLFTKGRR